MPEGIDAELRPVLRMTAPRAWTSKALETVAPGTWLGRRWLLLFGVLPIEYVNITIAEREPASSHEPNEA